MIAKIAIVCAVVAVGGYIYYSGFIDMGSNKNSDANEKITEGVFAPINENNMKGSGSFNSILSLKKNVVCSFLYTQEGLTTQTVGKVYANGEKMRASLLIEVDGRPTETKVINDGKEMYVWGSGASGDIAMKFTIDEKINPEEVQKQFDMNTSIDYSCQDWNIDTSVFIPPNTVNFIKMSNVIQNTATSDDLPSASEMKSLQCSACTRVPNEAGKAECNAMYACI